MNLCHTLLTLAFLSCFFNKLQCQQLGKQTERPKTSDCPVCNRVLKAARDMTSRENQGGEVSETLGRYCLLQTISVEDQKFCYDIDNIKGEISRLLKLGASDERICRKIKAINPDFCATKMVKDQSFSRKKGIIYI